MKVTFACHIFAIRWPFHLLKAWASESNWPHFACTPHPHNPRLYHVVCIPPPPQPRCTHTPTPHRHALLCQPLPCQDRVTRSIARPELPSHFRRWIGLVKSLQSAQLPLLCRHFRLPLPLPPPRRPQALQSVWREIQSNLIPGDQLHWRTSKKRPLFSSAFLFCAFRRHHHGRRRGCRRCRSATRDKGELCEGHLPWR